jgi:hypothetical protein
MRRASLLAAALLFPLPACAPHRAAPPRPAPPPAASPAPAPPSDLGAGVLGEVRSRRFDLRFQLPDAGGFRVEDAKEPWLIATHAAAATQILVRTFREDGRASREVCEARARLWRALPRREGSLLVDERRLDVPAGFDTVAETRVAEAAPGAPLDGFVLAFGGRARRCFVFVAATRAVGPGAERLVAVRLATIVEVALAGVQLESELSAVPREPVR